jgi:hypothetical protein
MTAPELDFIVDRVEPFRDAATPHLTFKLQVRSTRGQAIHTVILQSQLQLDVARRQYTPDDQKRLMDLFGQPEQWPQTLRSMFWTSVCTSIPRFSDSISIDLHIPCTFDFNVATTKLFAGVNDGEIPVTFLFSGTVFYPNEQSVLQVGRISWEKEATHSIPLKVWRAMMDSYYPNSTWLCLHREAFERLNAFKTDRGMPTFEAAIAAAIK